MGFGSFISHLTAPITKALGPVGTAALLPVVTVSQLAANVADSGIRSAVRLTSAVAPPSPAVTQTHSVGSDPVVLPGNPNIPSGPSYSYYVSGPSGGGYGGGVYDYPQQSYLPPMYGGPTPWDYSTGYPTYSTPQYPISGGYSGGTPLPWEDLISLGLQFL